MGLGTLNLGVYDYTVDINRLKSKYGVLINEGGINWSWFTRIRLNDDDTVTILRFYRKHKGNYPDWTEDEKKAKMHPGYYAVVIWKEDEKRTALKYNVPGLGWKEIRNKKYIFDYE